MKTTITIPSAPRVPVPHDLLLRLAAHIEYLSIAGADPDHDLSQRDFRQLFDALVAQPAPAAEQQPIGWQVCSASATDEAGWGDVSREVYDALAGDERFYRRELYAAPVADPDDALDAARWRALIGSARIRPIGAAGCDQSSPHFQLGLAHVGVELWTRYGDGIECDNALGVRWLKTYADQAIVAGCHLRGS